MTSLVQIRHLNGNRRVALVEGDRLNLLAGPRTVTGLARLALDEHKPLTQVLAPMDDFVDYAAVHAGHGEWRLLVPIDHDEPARCHVTGTGLTHKASALNRNAMHEKTAELTDSMKMFRWGLEGGRPSPGAIGTAPEWFYKGNGLILRAHNEPLEWPNFAEDGGEEPEIAGVYLIDHAGHPRRLGLAQGNEFSDHKFEKRNYLYLAHSKLRACSLGPELVLDPAFDNVTGTVRVERAGATLWSKAIHSGEANMCHSVANMEHHHFKYALHRRPGDVHIHYFGADAFSFGEGITLAADDVMEVAFQGFGRPLRNPLAVDSSPVALAAAAPL